jgi:DNA polymerase III subunit epsilon
MDKGATDTLTTSIPLRDVEFCIIDLETTGGSHEYHSITEIGAVKYRGGIEIDRFTTLVNPGCAIPPFITVLTGITNTMVATAHPIEDTLQPLLNFIGTSVLVAHNARFDIGFINAALLMHDYEPLPNRVLDTVGLARRIVGAEVKNCKLSTLASSFNFPHQPSHRAINDVLATGDLLHLLIERAAGFGIFDLDEFAAMSKIWSHPQASKLKLTVDLPRTPGIYLFVDNRGDVLYVGKATNIRSRVRSYFGTADTRRKVGSLLKLMHAIHYVSTPDVLTAEVLELRMISKLRPRYNFAGTRSAKYCYVRLTLGEQWPRLTITTRVTATSTDLYLGPISTRSIAREVVDAIESVVPLRRCTVRMGRNYRAPDDAPMCSAAQLGLAHCPCSGTADPTSYALEVQRVVAAMQGNAQPIIDSLTDKMNKHSQAQRFEEAGFVLNRIEALQSVLLRTQSAQQLVAAGTFTFTNNNITYHVQSGLLHATHVDNVAFSPIPPPLKANFTQFLQPPALPDQSAPINSDIIDEVLCIARHHRNADNKDAV